MNSSNQSQRVRFDGLDVRDVVADPENHQDALAVHQYLEAIVKRSGKYWPRLHC